MPRYISVCESYGFRYTHWNEGQIVNVDESEVKSLPRNKNGEIVHFVLESDYVKSEFPVGGRSPINPNGAKNPNSITRKTSIAMAPTTEELGGSIDAVDVDTIRQNQDVEEGGMPPASRRGRKRKGE